MTARFPGLHPDAYVHPSDRAALGALRAVPGLARLLKLLAGGVLEDHMHLLMAQTSIQLGPKQYPSIFRMVEHACDVLDVDMPEVYLDTSYQVNAWAFGFTRYTVTVYSGLVDLISEREMQAIIGHEVGHIHCEHMLYKSAADLLRLLGTNALTGVLGSASAFASTGLELALRKWSRAAELSCDRAALLVVQDPEVAASALARLAGATGRFREEFSLQAVLEQAETVQAAEASVGRVLDAVRQISLTHPDPVTRVREVIGWASSEAYGRLLAGHYPTRSQVAERARRPTIDWDADGT